MKEPITDKGTVLLLNAWKDLDATLDACFDHLFGFDRKYGTDFSEEFKEEAREWIRGLSICEAPQIREKDKICGTIYVHLSKKARAYCSNRCATRAYHRERRKFRECRKSTSKT